MAMLRHAGTWDEWECKTCGHKFLVPRPSKGKNKDKRARPSCGCGRCNAHAGNSQAF